MSPRPSFPERDSFADVTTSGPLTAAAALPDEAPERHHEGDVELEIDEDLDLPTTGNVDDDEPSGSLDEGDDADAIDDSDDGGESPLDDAEASDLDAGEDEIDETDDDDGDESDVDVGPLDDEVDIGEESELGDEAAGDAAGDDDGIDLEERAAADDGGIEGTNEAPEDAVDESALPELDADEDADEGDEDLAEVLLADAQTEPPPWDATRWTPLEGAGASAPCSALAIAAGRVAAAGEVVLLVGAGELTARTASFGAGVVAVAASDDLLFTATARGHLAMSQGAWTEAISLGNRSAGPGPIELVATPGRGFIHRDGALHRVTPPDLSLAPVRERGVIAAAASAGAVLLLATSATGLVIERLRGDDEGRHAAPLRGAARRLAEAAATQGTVMLVAAAGGRTIAFTDGARIAISRDDSASFAIAAFGPILALAFAGDDDDAALLILTEGGTVVQLPVRGEATRVAAIEGVGGAPAAIAWDPARECAWVACRAGLIAIGRAPRH